VVAMIRSRAADGVAATETADGAAAGISTLFKS